MTDLNYKKSFKINNFQYWYIASVFDGTSGVLLGQLNKNTMNLCTT